MAQFIIGVSVAALGVLLLVLPSERGWRDGGPRNREWLYATRPRVLGVTCVVIGTVTAVGAAIVAL